MSGSLPNPIYRGYSGATPSWLPMYENYAPRLYADFVNSLYWADWHYQQIDDWTGAGSGPVFSRTSAGTYLDSSGVLQTAAAGVPRIHTVYPSGPSGLLLEGQRTNLLLQSQAFDDAAWLPQNTSVTANQTTAPDGTQTADLLFVNTNNSSHYLNYASLISGAVTQTYTHSVYVKAAGTINFSLRKFSQPDVSVSAFANFNLNTSAVTLQQSAGVTNIAGIEPLPNGWYRCWQTYALTGTDVTHEVRFLLLDASGNVVYTGNGSDGVYIFGAQLELAGNPSSYIATTTATATRTRDLLTRRNADDVIDSSHATLFAYFAFLYDNPTISFPGVLGVHDATNSNATACYLFGRTSDDIYTSLFNNGGVGSSPQQSGLTYGVSHKFAGAYQVNDVAITHDGIAAATASSLTPPTVDRFIIGDIPAETQASGTAVLIRQIAYWPFRLGNQTLRYLTT